MKIPEESGSAAEESLLAVCVFAAFADGEKTAEEREAVRKVAEGFGSEDLAALTRKILMQEYSLADAVTGLAERGERLLAYEMALGICEAGGSVTADEQKFLDRLRGELGLAAEESREAEDEVSSVALVPVVGGEIEVASVSGGTSGGPDNGGMILRYAILNGALELLPETLATLAILPLQMKMVYRIGRAHGVELGAGNIKEFLAAAGIGLGSQVLEGFARKFMGKAAKRVAGKLAGKAAGQITGSAFSFGSTYAIGHLADRYYAGGGRLDAAAMKDQFETLRGQASELHARYLPEIQQRATGLTPAAILSLVTGKGSAV